MESSVVTLVLLPLGLGLLGFFEPCSIGSSLLFLKSVEPNSPSVRLLQAGGFAAVRALFIGALGAAAALVGTAFLAFQRAGYIVLGSVYLTIGLIYLAGQAQRLTARIGPGLQRLSSLRGTVALAVFFGFNVPACAAPLLAAVLGSAAVAEAGRIERGFVTLALFGLGLSLPLLLALAVGPAQRALEALARYSRRVPIAIGLLFVVLGAWSIYSGVVGQR